MNHAKCALGIRKTPGVIELCQSSARRRVQMVEANETAFRLRRPAARGDRRYAGRQVLDAIVDGRLPQAPISQVLNFWVTEVSDGVAAIEGEPAASSQSRWCCRRRLSSHPHGPRGPAPRIRCFRVDLDTQRSRPRGISQGLSRPRPTECAPRRVSSRGDDRLFWLKCMCSAGTARSWPTALYWCSEEPSEPSPSRTD
jgi:hypothetical protein